MGAFKKEIEAFLERLAPDSEAHKESPLQFGDDHKNNIYDDVGLHDIYNEASLQLELVLFLRKEFSNYRVEIERNIDDFGIPKDENSKKKRMDIVIFKEWEKLCAIELKVPKLSDKKKYDALTMLGCCQDIAFMEHVKAKDGEDGFRECYVLILTENHRFWSRGSGKVQNENNELYTFFHCEREIAQSIEGAVTKEYWDWKKQRKTFESCTIEHYDMEGVYKIEWETLREEHKKSLKYALIEIT